MIVLISASANADARHVVQQLVAVEFTLLGSPIVQKLRFEPTDGDFWLPAGPQVSAVLPTFEFVQQHSSGFGP